MPDITNDIQSLTTFRRRTGDFMKQLKKTRRPVVLTVKGKAAAVVQDARAYQQRLDIAALACAEEGIHQGLEYVKCSETHAMPGRSSRISKPGMAYVVKISARAQRDLAQIYRRINADDSNAALIKWYCGFRQAILRPEEQPNRCPVTKKG